MKKLLVIFLITGLTINVMAQQDPNFSQNMFLVPSLNPGAIGQSDKICVAAAFRNQWAGLPSAPTVTSFTAHSPFSLLGRSHGVGINMVNDNIGFNNDLSFNLAYSYKADIGNGILGIGATGGFINAALEPEWDGAEGIITPEGDYAIPNEGESVFGFDMGLGVYYSTENIYAGISTSHLNRARFKYQQSSGGESEVRMTRYVYAVAGYTIQLPDPMLELTPSFMIQTDGIINHIYLNANLRYNKKFWGGVSYTVKGALTALAGIELMNGIMVGYSYDIGLSSLQKYNSGSHEITVRYCFDLSLDKSPQKYESIRFL